MKSSLAILLLRKKISVLVLGLPFLSWLFSLVSLISSSFEHPHTINKAITAKNLNFFIILKF
ncbi:MAG TPA: hypothetical protein DER05_14165 [Lutibacter sp.]|nr:hypothetical protein [Lutibacter sp.]